MAKVILHPLINSISNTMGNMVFYTKYGKTYVRKKGVMIAAPSARQSAQRGVFRDVVELWHCLSGIVQESWKAYNGEGGKTGYNAFIGANVPRRRSNRPLVVSMPLGERHVPGIAAVPGPAGGISFALMIPAKAGCRHASVFVHMIEPGDGRSVMTRHDFDEAATYTITGLQAGRRYALCAVLTDAAYADAAKISAPSSVECVAG